ncbi:hypothetical protein KCP73_14550 [Salmonella enterica subsp. enterica]|nr:hypothetical protein KCP73_14550 [Salmonella enterica subsp. enterica]
MAIAQPGNQTIRIGYVVGTSADGSNGKLMVSKRQHGRRRDQQSALPAPPTITVTSTM